ncbi:hypothetical protein SRB5_38250 [Streptomyces sp. RB5]|uniref:RNA polymerase sigma-70 region 2 domain-containing protein n=1 Tax=Streptomyces smaragdinus TaxID=2585196 RepID=A0A7K0CJL0_9ACTN|nr:hypothetical protein [Streptomyces smaragdinus]
MFRAVPSESPPPDAVLLRAVARGDTDALAALYDRHAGWLLVRLGRRCGDGELAGEVTQDTFLTVWRTAAAFADTGGGSAGGWLWTIAARRLVDAQRSAARAARGLAAAGAPVPSAASAPSAEEHVLAGGLEPDVLRERLAGVGGLPERITEGGREGGSAVPDAAMYSRRNEITDRDFFLLNAWSGLDGSTCGRGTVTETAVEVWMLPFMRDVYLGPEDRQTKEVRAALARIEAMPPPERAAFLTRYLACDRGAELR